MPDSATIGSLDFRVIARLYETGACTPQRAVSEILSRLESYADPAVWIHRAQCKEVLAQARLVEQRQQAGANLPLYGVTFGVKDSIDVAGYPTTAACEAYSYMPERSAPVVERLLAAGALFVGKTNLDQFASGLAGDRSPYGACRNSFSPTHISGGSSSGSAVAVAAGLVSFALATDTAGSTRVPAGCNYIVGLKPAVGLLSTEGVIPCCPSLDCLTIMALTAEDAFRVMQIARGTSAPATELGTEALPSSFATPRDEDLEFFGDREQADLFQRAVSRLEQSGARRISVDFRPFREVARLLYEGPWLAERLASVSDFMQAHAGQMHPVTRGILEGGRRFSAVDYFKALERLKHLRSTCLKIFDTAEVLVVPTMPTIPTLAAVQADSVEWSRRLGYYTNFANFLRLAAIAAPSGFTTQGLPAGITFLSTPGSERRLCEIGMAWQRLVDLPLGATSYRLPEPANRSKQPIAPIPEGWARVSVAGAHLRGQPLHAALLATGARFVRVCQTAARYRFMAFMDLRPPRPGLLRDEERGGAVQVEIYDLPMDGFGRLVASVAPPLAIGTVELADGEAVKGFLCESWAARNAHDITEFGGWIAFHEHETTNRLKQLWQERNV